MGVVMRAVFTIIVFVFAMWAFPITAHAAATTVTYTYDTLGRVTKATYSTGTTITYTYDAAGNRTAQTVTCPATGC
jgi:YD repeat-containing protein